MNIHVIVFGTLLKPQGKDDFVQTVADGATVQELLLAIGYQPQHVKTILITLNGQHASHLKKLKDGDEVVLSVMVGGG
jgi:sulfur carrier protein ThiS